MRLDRLLITGMALFGSVGAAMALPEDGGITFQEAVTPVMEKVTSFHNFVFIIITIITLVVMGLMLYIMVRFNEKANPVPSKTSHNTLLEVVWTAVPVAILLVMVVPSMQLLYLQDDIPEAELTVKATGNTWNWEYSYPDYENIDSFVSNVLEKPDADAAGKPYLLAADVPLVVPVDTTVKVLVTSNNNIHSFAVPQFGVKIDAIPGRINETWFHVNAGKEGTYYGQCSEICGVRHAYMPIEIKVVSKAEFAQWVANDGEFTTAVAGNTLGGGSILLAQE